MNLALAQLHSPRISEASPAVALSVGDVVLILPIAAAPRRRRWQQGIAIAVEPIGWRIVGLGVPQNVSDRPWIEVVAEAAGQQRLSL